MTTAPDSSRTSDARAALDAARVVLRPESVTPAPLAWSAAQQVLRIVTGRAELNGQALIGEARRMGALTLTDAHALIALVSIADRTDRPAESESARGLQREALMALEHAVDINRSVGAASAPPFVASSTAAASAPSSAAYAEAPSRRRVSAGLVLGLVLLLIAIITGAWYLLTQRSARAYDDGVAAYGRGAREVARTAFASAAQKAPDDARPLVFLGRMSREDGDFARARRFLTTAVRIAPNSALATRELASVMLADGQPEIARRFYVRAVELDPTDLVAQGFLGCSLVRLNRFDEARRWFDRAGPGDWSRCAAAMPMPMPMPPAGSPMGAPMYPPPSPR